MSHQERALIYFQSLVTTPGCAKQVAALKSAPCLTHQLSIRHEAASIKSHYSYCSYRGLAFTHLPPLYNLLLPPSFVETTPRFSENEPFSCFQVRKRNRKLLNELLEGLGQGFPRASIVCVCVCSVDVHVYTQLVQRSCVRSITPAAHSRI